MSLISLISFLTKGLYSFKFRIHLPLLLTFLILNGIPRGQFLVAGTIVADHYEPDNTIATAKAQAVNTFSPGDQTGHSISPIGDVDYISIVVPYKTTLYLNLNAPGPTDWSSPQK